MRSSDSLTLYTPYAGVNFVGCVSGLIIRKETRHAPSVQVPKIATSRALNTPTGLTESVRRRLSPAYQSINQSTVQ